MRPRVTQPSGTLDVLPFLAPAAEWTALAPGLRQRARLLNAVAADLYGPQRLLREGLLPPALVFRHPGFLRPCCGVQPPGGVFLHLVAFDLARDASGTWRVVNTRAQAPSGAGYALENRATIPRIFPGAFRDLHVQALAPFFESLKDAIVAAAPCEEPSPHVVLLTPGPYNETYFEHSYLARHLGFPLVEGADLMVRHDRVFLKTIPGFARSTRSFAAWTTTTATRSSCARIQHWRSRPGAGVACRPRARRQRVRHERA